MRLWPAMRPPASAEEASTDTAVYGGLQKVYSNTKNFIDAQVEGHATLVANHERYATEMADILALLEMSARNCEQCPGEILLNLIRDPEDAVRRERQRAHLRLSSETAKATLAASQGMLARAKYLATLMDSVDNVARAACQSSKDAKGEQEKLLGLLMRIMELRVGAGEEMNEFILRLEDLKRLTLSQCDAQED